MENTIDGNDLELMSNNQILIEIKQMELDHEALKQKMLRDYDLMEALEKRFDKANKIIKKRLTNF